MATATNPFRIAIAVGIVLAVIGVGSYVAIEDAHITTIIPAIYGVVLVGLGRYGLESDGDRSAAYGLGALSALGIVASSRAVGDLLTLATGGSVDNTPAVASQGLMIALSLVVLVAVAVFLLGER